MENGISELRRRANLRRDIEGQTDLPTNRHGHLRWTLDPDFSPISSFICQICRLIFTYKRRTFGLLFLVLETGAAVLDGIGKGKLDLLLASFVLSTIGFFITLCAYVKRRARSASTVEIPAVSQLRVVEFVFSSIQFIASLLQLLLAHLKEKKMLDVKNNIDASVFPVAFAMVAVVFIFKNDEAITNSSQEDFQQPVELDLIGTLARNQDGPSISLDIMPEPFFDTVLPNLQVHNDTSLNMEDTDLVVDSPQRHIHLVEDSPALTNSDESSNSTLIEPDPAESLSENQVNPVISSLRMRTNVTSKMTPAAQISQQDEDAVNHHKEEEDYMNVWPIVEVYMTDTNIQKPLDLLKLTGYADLYKKVREMFNIDVEYLQHSKWILIFQDDDGDLIYLGNDPWEEFIYIARKIYILEKDKLENRKKIE